MTRRLHGAMAYPHDERLRKTGRRKLVLRKKAHSYPSTSAMPTPFSPTPVQRLEQIQPTRHDERPVTPEHRHPRTAVRDYAAVSAQNSRYRRKMEDVCVAIPQFQLLDSDATTATTSSFFGVYDGHGSDFCARYAAEHLHTRLAASIQLQHSSRRRRATDESLTDDAFAEDSRWRSRSSTTNWPTLTKQPRADRLPSRAWCARCAAERLSTSRTSVTRARFSSPMAQHHGSRSTTRRRMKTKRAASVLATASSSTNASAVCCR
ncbi:hypothetical protein PINS_up007453 [Pythium insidiosum]|nr:hypothetical protein PINS_up007453 [Pythium insidiosum]